MTQTRILAVNRAFYDAFAAGDYSAVKQMWAVNHEISVIHPGSVALHGQEAVMMSWKIIFKNSGAHDIKCSNEKVYLTGDSAYVVCNEIFPEGQLTATNIFVIEDEMWKLVHHQAGPCPGVDENLSQTNTQETSGSLH